MPNFPYPYQVNGKLVTGNGTLIPINFLSNRSLFPSLTVLEQDSKENNASLTALFGTKISRKCGQNV